MGPARIGANALSAGPWLLIYLDLHSLHIYPLLFGGERLANHSARLYRNKPRCLSSTTPEHTTSTTRLHCVQSTCVGTVLRDPLQGRRVSFSKVVNCLPAMASSKHDIYQ